MKMTIKSPTILSRDLKQTTALENEKADDNDSESVSNLLTLDPNPRKRTTTATVDGSSENRRK